MGGCITLMEKRRLLTDKVICKQHLWPSVAEAAGEVALAVVAVEVLAAVAADALSLRVLLMKS